MCIRDRYYLPLYSCEDLNYQELLEGIRTYCGNYNYFVWKTTIEGALITEENLEMFEEFATKTKVIPKKLKDVSGYLDTRRKNERLNYVRLVFDGKSDFLLTKKQISKKNPRIYPDILYNLGSVHKTSGWVSRWIEYYFLESAEIGYDLPNGFRMFSSWIEQEGRRESLIIRFQRDFKELYRFLRKIEIEKNRDDFMNK